MSSTGDPSLVSSRGAAANSSADHPKEPAKKKRKSFGRSKGEITIPERLEVRTLAKSLGRDATLLDDMVQTHFGPLNLLASADVNMSEVRNLLVRCIVLIAPERIPERRSRVTNCHRVIESPKLL